MRLNNVHAGTLVKLALAQYLNNHAVGAVMSQKNVGSHGATHNVENVINLAQLGKQQIRHAIYLRNIKS